MTTTSMTKMSQLFQCSECYTKKFSNTFPRGWALFAVTPLLPFDILCEDCFAETRQKNPDLLFVEPNPEWKEPVSTKYPKDHIEILWTKHGKMGYTTLVEWGETTTSRRYLSVFTSHTKADSIVKAIQDACLGIVAPFTEKDIIRAVEQGKPYGTV